MRVSVRDNDVDQAIRALKRKMLSEGLFQAMRRLEAYEKPSERRVRERREAIARERKRRAQQLEQDGF